MQRASAIYRSDEEVFSLVTEVSGWFHRWQKVADRACERQTVDGTAFGIEHRMRAVLKWCVV
jgi:hypothetical protein